MKKEQFTETKLGKFLSGKGFYAALCASIITVGAAGYLTYKSTTSKLENQLSGIQPPVTTQSSQPPGNSTASNDFDASAGQVNIPKKDVPKSTTTTTTPTTTTPTTTTTAKDNKSKSDSSSTPTTTSYLRPVIGEVISPFSNGELVKSKTLGSWKTHDGIDLAAKPGEPVQAIAPGTVTKVFEDPLWGVCVIVEHQDTMQSHYYNLNKTLPVKVDQKVAAGETLGSIGDSAEAEISDPSHLHFAIKKDGKWLDPIKVLGF